MSWIKPNFLWMMYRSGWGTKPGQEVVLAIWLKRTAFDAILAEAVHSTYTEAVYGSQQQWKQAGQNPSVRLQWDPDHDPSRAPFAHKVPCSRPVLACASAGPANQRAKAGGHKGPHSAPHHSRPYGY
jgi:Domain of unknown function (DUF4291)